MVHQRGIVANPSKIKAILEMSSPKSLREIQALTGRLATLNRFISKAIDKCKPFFEAIKKGKGEHWNEECEHTLQ